MTAPVVFVSYSHKDETWKDKFLPQLRALEQAGVAMHVWEDRQIDAGATWYPEIQMAMGNAAVAILLVSADYLASSFCIKEEVPFLIRRQEQEGMLLIPVLIHACPWKAHRWLADRQMLPRDGKCIAIDFPGDQANAVFSKVAEQVFEHFKKLAEQPETAAALPKAVQKHIQAIVPTAATLDEPLREVRPWPTLASDRVNLTHLPETGDTLFGRDEELQFLDKAWSPDQLPTTRVVAFVAQGGVGKSTLVNRWLDEMRREQFRGATRIFGWSFYSQGTREQGGASADTFIAAALRFFGDTDPMAGSPWDKGDRLARLVGAERSLLILDGLEPLQSPQAFERGKVRDPAIERLLRGLARQSSGLCLITTRETLIDLAGRPGYAARDLDQITPQAGRALLRTARVVGTDQELEELAAQFGPHALAVSLLGVYLYEQPGHGVGPAKALAQLPGKDPVERVLAGFEQWLGDSPELEALRLLGFFDRPADDGCLEALRCEPAIKGLTDRLVKLEQSDWDRTLARLAKLRLIHRSHNGSGMWLVDAHPLLREYLAKQLCDQKLDAWRAGHKRLYEHLCSTTKEGKRPTLEDLQPLYQAVAHGCQAGLQQEACDTVYYARIARGNEAYVVKKLGAIGSDLGAVACFFEPPWIRVSPTLREGDQAWLLNESAFRLMALGRLTEALDPMRAGLAGVVKLKDWKNAAIHANNLSELELRLGDVSGGVKDAEQSATYADRSGDAFEWLVGRATHADALHQAGRRAEAETHFQEAEQIGAKKQPEYPLLYSLSGFKYCDLLLAAPERNAWQKMLMLGVRGEESELVSACCTVSQRAAQALKIAEDNNFSLLGCALDRLTLGCAALYSNILNHSHVSPLTLDLSRIETTVSGLHRAGAQEFIVRGLLTRAWLYTTTDNLVGAQADLEEAWDIAQRGPMRLFMADIHLHRARLFFRETNYPWESPEADLMAAEKLINDCGYHRRDEELADAKRAILGQ